MAANVSKPSLKIVGGKDMQPPHPASAGSRQDKVEYFCMRMEEDKPTETHGPFPSEKAAEDAVNEWFSDGEWYLCTKTKVVSKKENPSGKTH